MDEWLCHHSVTSPKNVSSWTQTNHKKVHPLPPWTPTMRKLLFPGSLCDNCTQSVCLSEQSWQGGTFGRWDLFLILTPSAIDTITPPTITLNYFWVLAMAVLLSSRKYWIKVDPRKWVLCKYDCFIKQHWNFTWKTGLTHGIDSIG